MLDVVSMSHVLCNNYVMKGFRLNFDYFLLIQDCSRREESSSSTHTKPQEY